MKGWSFVTNMTHTWTKLAKNNNKIRGILLETVTLYFMKQMYACALPQLFICSSHFSFHDHCKTFPHDALQLTNKVISLVRTQDDKSTMTCMVYCTLVFHSVFFLDIFSFLPHLCHNYFPLVVRSLSQMPQNISIVIKTLMEIWQELQVITVRLRTYYSICPNTTYMY